MRLAIVLCTLAVVGISFTAEADGKKKPKHQKLSIGITGADMGEAHAYMAQQQQQAAAAQQNRPSSDPPAVKAGETLTMAYPTGEGIDRSFGGKKFGSGASIKWSDGTVYADTFHESHKHSGVFDLLMPEGVTPERDAVYYSMLHFPSMYVMGSGYSVSTKSDAMSCDFKGPALSCTQGQQTFTVTMTGTNISVNNQAVATFTKPTLTLTGQVTNYQLLAIVNFLLKDAKK